MSSMRLAARERQVVVDVGIHTSQRELDRLNSGLSVRCG
jgi:hypothetical protein